MKKLAKQITVILTAFTLVSSFLLLDDTKFKAETLHAADTEISVVFPISHARFWENLLPSSIFAIFKRLPVIATDSVLENSHSSSPERKNNKLLDFSQDLPDLRFKNDAPERYYELTRRVLSILPREHVEPLRTLVIKYDDESERGLGGRSTIILNAKKKGKPMRDEEFVSVLIHEMGHVTDLGAITAKSKKSRSNFRDHTDVIWNSDPSVDFYSLSWSNETFRLPSVSSRAFTSEYGMSDPFEDFAESYHYYIVHGKEFRFYTYSSPLLKKKYNFLKNEVFGGYEFKTGSLKNVINSSHRYWDSTLLAYDLRELLSLEPSYLNLTAKR